MNMFNTENLQILLDELEFRKYELEQCKTQKEKDVLLDRWQRQDSATEIANAIRSLGDRRRGLFF